MTFKGTCPECRQEFPLPDDGVATEAHCPSCGTRVSIQQIPSADMYLAGDQREWMDRIHRVEKLIGDAPPDVAERAREWVKSRDVGLIGNPEEGFRALDPLTLEAELNELEDSLDYAPGSPDLRAKVLHGLHTAQEHFRETGGQHWPWLQAWTRDVETFVNSCSRAHAHEFVRALEAAGMHSTASAIRLNRLDYAPGVTDLRERLLFAVRSHAGAPATAGLWDLVAEELAQFLQAAKLHQYSRADVLEVVDAYNAHREHLDQRLRELKEELARTERQYARGPVHLVALERQLLAYRAAKDVEHRLPHVPGALMPATVGALRTAEPYCWSPECVDAVVAAASQMVGWEQPNEAGLGPVAGPGASGWFYFEQPVPVPTLSKARADAPDAPVAALLWRREVHDGEPGTWFTTFVDATVELFGRDQLVPSATASWVWRDVDTLEAMRERAVERYREMVRQGRYGERLASEDVMCDAMVWFSRFWLAAGLWLQQRVLLPGSQAVPRQPGRALARQHKLQAAPLVKVVQLRLAVPRGEDAYATHGAVDWSCRWVVKGHWRKQWYPSKGQHFPKWIDSYPKGPEDKPLRVSTTVYAVTR